MSVLPPTLWWVMSVLRPRLVQVRDDELRRILTEANPWWGAAATSGSKTAWMRNHRVLTARANFDLGYRNDILRDVATGPVTDALILLVGPRRVGKSVVILDCIGELCGRADIDPRQIIHVPCDGFRTQDLHRIITLGRALTSSIDLQSPRPRLWFLDEVGTVRGWSAVLKRLRDQTIFGDDTVIATGSRWVSGEDVEGNLFAGRAGHAQGRRLRPVAPMTFREYFTVTSPGTLMFAKHQLQALQSPAARADLEAVQFGIDAYDLAWQAYLTSGGFPRAVSEYHRTGVVSSSFLQDLSASLRGEVDPESSPDSIPLLLELLHRRAANPFNMTNNAQELGFTRDKLNTRISRLIGSFAALKCPQMDDFGHEIPGSQPKLYLTDSILAWLPAKLRAGCKSPDFTTLSEMAIGVSLARGIDSVEQGRWASADTIGYERTTSGKEIDYSPVSIPTAAGTQKTIPIESKWVDDGWKSESKPLFGKYGFGIMATKSILDCSGPVWAVPAPLLAISLE